MWSVPANSVSAEALARDLGADVPVCVARQPTRMRGIGEVLESAPVMPPAWLVLVNPGKPLATATVFKSLNGRHSGTAPALPARFADAKDLADYLHTCTNDLAAPAGELLHDIGDVLAALAATDGCLLARLSGSGPTCFGLYADEACADATATALRRAHPAWWTVATPLLNSAR
jgi:4-diphosphocytidyl-2-C-methyl-D-erythritol kinase